MNKEKMIKWAEALESGKFEQTRGTYGGGFTEAETAPAGFCCLNVAFYIENGVTVYDRDDKSTCPLHQIRKTYGLKITQPFVNWNDHDKLSFKEIAGKIREMVDAED